MDRKGSKVVKVLVLGRIDPIKPYGWHVRPYYIYRYLRTIFRASKIFSVEVIPTCYLFARFRLFRVVGKLLQELISCSFCILVNSECMHFMWNALVKLLCILLGRQCIIITDIHGILHEQMEIYTSRFSLFTKILKLLELFSWKLSDYLTVCSAELAWKILRRYGNYPVAIVYDACEVSYCVSEIDESAVSNVERKFNLNNKTVLVLIAPRSNPANIMAIKFAYEVMRILLRYRRDIVLAITGGGRPVLKSMPDNVIYTGHLDREELFALLRLAKLGLAPYPKGAITGGARNKILDYWCAKVPVVATCEGVSGFTDIIAGKHYVYGGETPETFAKTILDVLQKPSNEILRIVEEAYKLLLSKYNWNIQITKIAFILLKILLRKLTKRKFS